MRMILILVFGGFLAIGCQRAADLPDSTGTFEATVTRVSCVEPGTIISLLVDEGQEVKAGDTIAVLDTAKLAIECESTKISLE